MKGADKTQHRNAPIRTEKSQLPSRRTGEVHCGGRIPDRRRNRRLATVVYISGTMFAFVP